MKKFCLLIDCGSVQREVTWKEFFLFPLLRTQSIKAMLQLIRIFLFTLPPDQSRASEWAALHKKVRDILRRNAKDQNRIQTIVTATNLNYEWELRKLQDEKQRISQLARPCFDEQELDIVLCKDQVGSLIGLTDPVASLYLPAPGFLPICERFKADNLNQADPSLSPLLFSSDE